MSMKLSDSWSTPQELFDQLNKKYGPFDLDACADQSNAKCAQYYDGNTDCLKQDWSSVAKTVWINPPYSDPNPFIRKAKEESLKGIKVVMLLKADHSTNIYAECVYDWKNECFYPGIKRVDLRKRVKFVPPPGLIGKDGLPVKAGSPNYPSMLIIFTKP